MNNIMISKKLLIVNGFIELVKKALMIATFLIISICICGFLKDKVICMFYVSGCSMENTLHDNDILLVSKVSNIDRGDVILIDMPFDRLVKRCVAVPGDSVYFNDGKLYVNNMLVDEPYIKQEGKTKAGLLNKYITLGDDEYIVLGDNRNNSKDSRSFGVVKGECIHGEVVFHIGIDWGNNIYAKQLGSTCNLLGWTMGIFVLMLFVGLFIPILADLIGIVVKTHGDELMTLVLSDYLKKKICHIVIIIILGILIISSLVSGTGLNMLAWLLKIVS